MCKEDIDIHKGRQKGDNKGKYVSEEEDKF